MKNYNIESIKAQDLEKRKLHSRIFQILGWFLTVICVGDIIATLVLLAIFMAPPGVLDVVRCVVVDAGLIYLGIRLIRRGNRELRSYQPPK